ncbi:MAG: peptidylprolyl isomerase [Tunicatimonas sp.]|uniref:peptidylprolyl isomerase n=1 Tax=Tunicatimonas sp. TaxID=1940096 RepID=UPI003C735AC7
MSLIGKIREKTALIVGAVAIGLTMFVVGGDLLSGSGGQILGGPDTTVGEIAGQEVSQDEYLQEINEQKANFALRTQRQPSEQEMTSIRQQAWNKLIAEKAFGQQFKKLGITVSERELIDMVQGNNIDPGIRQSFTDPNTGEFDRNQLLNYLQALPQLQPDQQISWQLYEQNLRDARERLKYDNLLIAGNYVTQEEAKRHYQAENKVAEVEYLYVPYYAVGDSAVSVTDAELQSYLDKHQEEYEVEENRAIQFVRFPIVPSEIDTEDFTAELDELKLDFTEATNDSTFAVIQSDPISGGAPYQSFNIGNLPTPLADSASNLTEGSVYGPFNQGDAYTLYKVDEVYEDTVSYARASHILIKTDDSRTEAEARSEAQDLLNQLRNGANFAELAREHSEDGSSAQGGDLGWFSEGQMVTPFEDAVFGQSETGLIPRLIKTDYGFHIITVSEASTNQAYKVAVVERELYPSDQTRDEAFREADLFASEIDGINSFTSRADQDSLDVREAENIQKNAQTVTGLTDARQVVQWAFRDASVGDISEVFELPDAYVVAVLTGAAEEGSAKLADVRPEVEAKVKAKKKGEVIVEKLNGLSGSLQEIANAYGTDANVYSSSDLKLSTNTLPNVGFAPEAIGRAFAMESGQVSEPITTENGVVIIKLDALTDAPEIADYATYKDQLQQQRGSRVAFNIAEAVEESADIEDERYKFY